MNQHKRILLLFLFAATPFLVNAQIKGPRKLMGGFSVSPRHKGYKEVIFGIGAANFLGELGGANQIGTNFVKDFDFESSRPSFQVAQRLKFDRFWGLKYGFYYQRISGNDKFTQEYYRQNRNLHFRSNVFELSGQIEFYFTKREQPAKRYKIKGARGYKNLNIQGYAFFGLGGFYFNPKAKYQSKWVALQPLGTEGQGLPNMHDKYSRFGLCIPYGIGFKQAVDKNWYVGIEIGARKTFTDYLDDVSNVYYDNAKILNQRGETAAYLADPKIYLVPSDFDPDRKFEKYGGADQGGAGQQRGDVRDKDSYMFVNITISYKLDKKASAFKRKFNRHF